MTLVINQFDAIFSSSSKIGGKANNLAQISKYNIPIWFVLTTDSFDLFLKENNLTELFYKKLSSLKEKDQIKSISIDILNMIEEANFSEAVLEIVSDKISKDIFYSVRSSATDEDGDNHSFAGIMESYLFQKGIESIKCAIKNCYKSCFSEIALSYRLEKKLPLDNLKMAVIIQEMVASEKSGVLFSTNPTNGDRYEFVISSNFGLGEGIVNGECETDEYIYLRFRGKKNSLSIINYTLSS